MDLSELVNVKNCLISNGEFLKNNKVKSISVVVSTLSEYPILYVLVEDNKVNNTERISKFIENLNLGCSVIVSFIQGEIPQEELMEIWKATEN